MLKNQKTKLNIFIFLIIILFISTGCVFNNGKKIKTSNNNPKAIQKNNKTNNKTKPQEQISSSTIKEDLNQKSNKQLTPSTEEADTINTNNWILFNSHKQAGTKLNFNLKYPNDWIIKGSIDGGQKSVIPFYKKSEYSRECRNINHGEMICNTKGQIAQVVVTLIIKDNNQNISNKNDNKYIIDGYEGYVLRPSSNKIQLVIPGVNNSKFEFNMTIDNENDEQVFYEIIKSIEFIE